MGHNKRKYEMNTKDSPNKKFVRSGDPERELAKNYLNTVEYSQLLYAFEQGAYSSKEAKQRLRNRFHSACWQHVVRDLERRGWL